MDALLAAARAIPQTVPASMPLLTPTPSPPSPSSSSPPDTTIADCVARVFGSPAPFANAYVIFVQHQLGDVFFQLKAMVDHLGLDPQRFWWLPIPYSQHDSLIAAVEEQFGVPAGRLLRHSYTPAKDYAVHMLERAQQLLADVLGTIQTETRPGERCRRLLVLDDGAYILAALAQMPAPPRDIAIALVEQTARGIFKMEDSPAMGAMLTHMPMVNVAQSAPKRQLEPRYVAEAVALTFAQYSAQHWPADIRPPRPHCLFLGNGVIGSAVRDLLCSAGVIEASEVEVWDPDAAALERARTAGFTVWERGASPAPRFDLVFGCAGRTSFSTPDLGWLRPGAWLFSVSSGAQEFAFHRMLDQARAGSHGLGLVHLHAHDMHQPVHFTYTAPAGGPGHVLETAASDPPSATPTPSPTPTPFVVANGGLPITFCGVLNPTLPDKFAVTCCSMVGGAAEAMVALEHGTTGLLPLNQQLCDWIQDAFTALEQANGWHEPRL